MRLNSEVLRVTGIFIALALAGGNAEAQSWMGGFGGGSVDQQCFENILSPGCDPFQRNQFGQNPITPTAPGTPFPTDRNGRPIIFIAQATPPELDCPLFENRPYDTLLTAMDSLTMSISTVPECTAQKGIIDAVQSNQDSVRIAVTELNRLYKGEGSNFQQQDLEALVTTATNSASNIGNILNNSTFLNSQCGKKVLSGGRALSALSDVLNGLAPYALMAVAVNPAMGVAAKFAITGGAVAASTAAGFVTMIEQGSVDMSNPEHRRAVLKNTCQFSKVARKVRYLQLAQSGHIQQMAEEVKVDSFARAEVPANNQFNQFQSVPGTEELADVLVFKDSSDRKFDLINQQTRKDSFELNTLEAQLKEFQNDDLYVCLMGSSLVKQSLRTDANVFPATVMFNLARAISMAQIKTDDTRLIAVQNINEISRQRLPILEAKALQDNSPAVVQLCAQTVKSWVSSLRQAYKYTMAITNDQRKALEVELNANPEYVRWNRGYSELRDKQITASRVANVMKELASDNSVIDRSELDQRMAILRQALFGSRGGIRFTASPAQAWLDHTIGIHRNRIASLKNNISRLQKAAYQITSTGQLTFLAPLTQETIENQIRAATLKTLTPAVVKKGTQGHEVLCQTLQSAALDWRAANDHIGACQFYCDMIDEHLDNKVNGGLIKFCRGEISASNQQIRASLIQTTRAAMNSQKVMAALSYRDWAKMISTKMTELKCSTPPLSVMR